MAQSNHFTPAPRHYPASTSQTLFAPRVPVNAQPIQMSYYDVPENAMYTGVSTINPTVDSQFDKDEYIQQLEERIVYLESRDAELTTLQKTVEMLQNEFASRVTRENEVRKYRGSRSTVNRMLPLQPMNPQLLRTVDDYAEMKYTVSRYSRQAEGYVKRSLKVNYFNLLTKQPYASQDYICASKMLMTELLDAVTRGKYELYSDSPNPKLYLAMPKNLLSDAAKCIYICCGGPFMITTTTENPIDETQQPKVVKSVRCTNSDALDDLVRLMETIVRDKTTNARLQKARDSENNPPQNPEKRPIRTSTKEKLAKNSKKSTKNVTLSAFNETEESETDAGISPTDYDQEEPLTSETTSEFIEALPGKRTRAMSSDSDDEVLSDSGPDSIIPNRRRKKQARLQDPRKATNITKKKDLAFTQSALESDVYDSDVPCTSALTEKSRFQRKNFVK